MNNIYLYGFATFGHPNDYRQSAFKFDKKEIAKNVRIFDLPNAIKVFPNSTLYSIRKESIGGVSGISYAIYTFANEMTSMRDGTFIGSSILFTNEIAEENITVGKLNEFHTILTSANTENDKLKVNHSDNFSHSNKFLEDFEKIGYDLKSINDIENFNSTNKHLVVGSWTDENKLTINFKKALLLLNKYDTIFFTSSKEILSYCQSRNIYSITDEKGFEQEIQIFEENKKQKTLSSLNEFVNEKQELDNDRKKTIENFKFQIEQYEQIHEENRKKIEEAKKQLPLIHQQYDNYSKLIDRSINELKSNRNLEVVRQIHYSNKREFITSINQQTQPNFINKIPKYNAKTELKQPFQPSNYKRFEEPSLGNERPTERSHKQLSEPKFDIFKILTFILFLLWVGTLIFFMFFNDTEKNITEVEPQENQTTTIEQPKVEQTSVKELTPLPNDTLTKKEYISIAKKITKDMPVKAIVQIIFDANPTDIKGHYSTQIEEYARKLIESNKDCFKGDSSKFVSTKDTLRHIPSYKKPK
jgi:hypothetical protein